jgi:hypothetical protein
MSPLVTPLILCLALVAAAPAGAQVYKWVDDKGVVNYSGDPPANRKSAQLDPNSVSVSVYATDKSSAQAAGSGGANERLLGQRIESLERRLDAERYSRQLAADAEEKALALQYEQCVRDRRVDCDYGGYDRYPLYGPALVFFRPRFRPRPIVPTLPVAAPASPIRAFPSVRSRIAVRG